MILILRKLPSLILILLIISNNLSGNTSEQSNRYHVSVLTYAPGTDLYSIFGHSSIRVIDDSLKKDVVYNYGTFSFNSNNFYTDFMKGKLLYRLSKAPTEYVILQNHQENRNLIENKLLLNQKEIRKLVRMLEINHLPQNCEYYYDFFFDNCATRILQVIDTASDFRLIKSHDGYKTQAFRKHTNKYLQTKPWIRLGINALMGVAADKKASEVETSFLPDYLLAILLKNPNVISTKEKILVKGTPRVNKYNMTSIYTFLLLLFLFIRINIWENRKKKELKLVDHIVFWPAISVGIVIISLWSYSDLEIYRFNLCLLWASPLYLIPLFKKKITQTLNVIFAACLILGTLYSVLYLSEWTFVIYMLIIALRIYKPNLIRAKS